MSKELEAYKVIEEEIFRSINDERTKRIVKLYKEQLQIIEEALKRNEPMKPLKVNNTKLIYWCSKCDCSSIQRYDKFCHECGQNLDWSDDE